MAEMADTPEMPEKKVPMMKMIPMIIKAITIEPVALLMLTGTMLSSMAIQTLTLEKACRVDLQLEEELCDALRNQDSDNNTETERIVQEFISPYITYKSIITSVLPCMLLLFAGGWMDLTGRRKIIMILPVIGQILFEVNNIIHVVLFYQLNVVAFAFTEAFLQTILGGWILLFLAVFSYITDITTEKNRTYRLGLVSFGVYIGMPIGITLSGLLLRNFGYMSVFITSLSLACLNASYITFRLRDPPRTIEHKKHDNQGVLYFMKSFFNPMHFINSLKVVFKRTPNNRITMLCILMVTACLVLGPAHGESAIMYLSTRYRFNWNELQFSMFHAFNMIVTTIGNMFAILVLSKKLGWHDSILGIISMTSKIAAAMLYCFAPTGIVFFFGPLVDMLNGTATIAIRSFLTKTVERYEISRLNSIMSLAEVLMPLAFIPLYVQVYTRSMQWMPGFVFLVGAAISVPPLAAYLWLFIRHRRGVNKEELKKMDPETENAPQPEKETIKEIE